MMQEFLWQTIDKALIVFLSNDFVWKGRHGVQSYISNTTLWLPGGR